MAGDLLFLDCLCCVGECMCEEARDDYAHTSVAVSAGAAAAVFDSAEDRQDNCLGASDPVDTWSFPGISNASNSISAVSCSSNIVSQVEVSRDEGHWDGTVSGSPSCIIEDAIAVYSGSFSFPEVYINLSGVITYKCVDGLYDYDLTVSASYWVYKPTFNTADHPTWTWSDIGTPGTVGGGYYGEKTIGGVDHVFQIVLLYGSAGNTTHVIQLAAVVHDPDTTVSLGAAPYDPSGLLVGTATVS